MKIWLSALTGAVVLLYVKAHYTDQHLIRMLKLLEQLSRPLVTAEAFLAAARRKNG